MNFKRIFIYFDIKFNKIYFVMFIGGQLKTKNGQKYIVNDSSKNGLFITKTCAISSVILAIAAVITAILITYVLTTNDRERWGDLY